MTKAVSPACLSLTSSPTRFSPRFREFLCHRQMLLSRVVADDLRLPILSDGPIEVTSFVRTRLFKNKTVERYVISLMATDLSVSACWNQRTTCLGWFSECRRDTHACTFLIYLPSSKPIPAGFPGSDLGDRESDQTEGSS